MGHERKLFGVQNKENDDSEADIVRSTFSESLTAAEASECVSENEVPKSQMQILEEALELCKFGYFHYKLMFASLMSVFTYTSVMTTSSYMLSSAECDLNMSIIQKGLLNAMPFIGQVGAGLFTGFITDAFGRKKFLVWGHAGMFVCALIEGSSQTYWMLLFGKFMDGIFLSFTFSGTTVMVSEFTHKGVRDRAFLIYSSFTSFSLILCALVAWGFLTRPWHFVITKYFVLHPWNIYLYSTTIIILVAMLMYINLPESPKFLLSVGKEYDALEVIKRIYHENSGKPKESFPITSFNASGVHLTSEKKTVPKQLKKAFSQSKELFERPLVFKLILFSVATFICLLAYSSLRLWFPQLSTIVENYQNTHGGETANFCIMIDWYTREEPKNASLLATSNTTSDVCVPHFAGAETYINGMILGFMSLVIMSISGTLIYRVGQKLLMFISFVLCAVCSAGLYWSSSSVSIALLVAGACALMQCALSLQNNILVRVVPTTVRTLRGLLFIYPETGITIFLNSIFDRHATLVALSIIVMTGRAGSLVGSIIFPLLLKKDCMFPFLTLAVVTLSMAALVCIFPNPSKENSGIGDN